MRWRDGRHALARGGVPRGLGQLDVRRVDTTTANEPAGMSNSDAYELDHVNHNLAVGYEPEQTPHGVEYRNNIFQHVIRGGPAGGGYSTVDDLTRFAEALKHGRLVSTAGVRLLTTPKPELTGIRLRLHHRRGGQDRRAQRRLSGNQLTARHLRRGGVHGRRDGELRRRRAPCCAEGAHAAHGWSPCDLVEVILERSIRLSTTRRSEGGSQRWIAAYTRAMGAVTPSSPGR
jgi:hypothetical protein